MIRFITLTCNRPDFIELQFNSIRNHVHEEFSYEVFDSSNGNDEIFDVCKTLNVTHHKIPVICQDKHDPSRCCGFHLNQLWKSLGDYKGIIFFIDSDMFLIKDINILSMMQNFDMSFIPVRKPSFFYAWPNLVIVDAKKVDITKFDWTVTDSPEGRLDTGGSNWSFFKNSNLNIQFFDDHFLHDDNAYHYCGNDYIGEVIDNNHANYEKLNAMVKDIFPKPYYYDMITMCKSSFEEAFVLHYKSGSNYQPFATEEYNRLKTIGLRVLLKQFGSI